MVTAHGHEQGATFCDPAGHLGDTGKVAHIVGALDRHVANIGHRETDEMLTAGLDVIPARGARAGRGVVVELLPR